MAGNRRGLGRWAVRALGILGVLLITLSAVGWWLSTRVLDSDGFADVVAKSSQRDEVRDYIADQATLRLAKSSNFVSAARPVVADAISEAITTGPVQEAVHDFAAGAHDQIFRISTSSRVNVSSAQAAVTVRAALDAISPALSKKLPSNVLEATTTISQNTTVDRLFRATRWIRALYIPVLLIGIAVLAFTLVRARDRVHAIRAVGVIMAVAGALLLGIGAATPAFAVAAATNDPGRGDAVAQFIDVLVGRLVGAGRGMFVVGLALALAPGHDGGDLRNRADRVRAWFAAKRLSPRWRFAGGLALALVAALALTVPGRLFELALYAAAILLLYVGIVVCLRASGVLVTDHTIKRLHKREVALVFAALVAGALVTSSGAVTLVAASTEEAKANPTNQGCNGYIELCAQSVDQIVWPGSHNAMSSAAYDFFGAEHTISVAEQLNSGVRFLMLDAYYGYDDHGLVRTNLAGGANRDALAEEHGENAVRELDRLGALTGTADTSGEKKDLYFCHDFCELGAVPADRVLGDIRDFLDRNLTDVVIIDIEDYVTPKDFRQALLDADLLDKVWTPKTPGVWPSLHKMVDPRHGEPKDKRLIVMFEKQSSKYKWLLNTYDVSEETPYAFKTVDDFTCAPNRGKTGKSLFIVNHWINPGGLPDPVRAGKTNSAATLDKRAQNCITERQKLPTTFAVNFTVSGDLFKTVNRLNAAVARETGVTAAIDDAIDRGRKSGELTRSARKDINALKRLPRIGEKKARALLGPLVDSLAPPKGLDRFVNPPKDSDETAPDGSDETPPDEPDEQPR